MVVDADYAMILLVVMSQYRPQLEEDILLLSDH